MPDAYDCVLFPHPFEPLTKPGGGKRVLIVHDLIPLVMPVHSARGLMDYLYFRYHLRHALRVADRIVADSDNTKEDIVRWMKIPESKISVILIGFNSSLITLDAVSTNEFSADEFGKYILYFGNFMPHKNVQRLIEAFAIIHSKRPEVKLVLVGWITSKIYQETVERLKVKESVFFLNELPAPRLAALLRRALVYAHPSLYEGFGMPPLEAMAAGVPVAVSRSSSLPQVCGKAAVYFNPYDVHDMADVILRLIANEELRRELIQRGKKQAQAFNWASTAQDFVKMISSLL